MDKLLYIAMNGASETMKAQAVNSQNLANASTTGFRADLESYASQPVYGPGHASRVYGIATGKGVDFTPGSAIGTGRDLDISINGKGWIAVQGPDGNEAYTRAGDLQVDSLGLLRTGAGPPVIGSGSPIAIPPFEKIEIGADGTISILPVGQAHRRQHDYPAGRRARIKQCECNRGHGQPHSAGTTLRDADQGYGECRGE